MVIFSFERIISLNKKSGGDGAVDTPVPISNTEVKHRSGEDIRKDKIASRRAFFIPRKNINNMNEKKKILLL